MICKKKNNVKIILSFDDYHSGNLRLAEMCLKYKLPATFFIEILHLHAPEQIERLNNLGFEIGSHTWSHPTDLKAIPLTEAKSEIEVSKKMIENLTGKACDVFAYPRGRYNEDIVNLVKNAGFKEARTNHVLKTGHERIDPFQMPTTIHISDSRKEYGDRGWFTMAEFYLNHVIKRGGMFHLWGHAAEIEKDEQWDLVDSFLKELSQI